MAVNATSGGSTAVGVGVTTRTLSRTTSGTYRASTIHSIAYDSLPSSVAYPTGTPVTTIIGQQTTVDSRFFPNPPTGSTTITVTWPTTQAWALIGVIEFASTLSSGLTGLAVRSAATRQDITAGGVTASVSATIASSVDDRCGAIAAAFDLNFYGSRPLIAGHTQTFSRQPDSDSHARGANFAGAAGTATGTLTVADNLGYAPLELDAVFFSIQEVGGGGPSGNPWHYYDQMRRQAA